jgi:hypothetical protein
MVSFVVGCVVVTTSLFRDCIFVETEKYHASFAAVCCLVLLSLILPSTGEVTHFHWPWIYNVATLAILILYVQRFKYLPSFDCLMNT